ncbi:MAG: FtsX-like permease family protein [Clostridium sp.]|nr:FtsX-like permease family protein [Clostridium sp.]
MYILKNALKNLRRNKGRNILIGIIMIAILSCTAISIIINTTANGIIEDYKNKFGSEVFIQANQEKQNEKINKGNFDEKDFIIPNNVYEELAKSEHIKEAIMSSSFRGYSEDIKAIDQEDKENTNMGNVITMGPSGNQPSPNMKLPNLNILGGLNLAGTKEFESGARKITDGKFPENEGEAIISEDFAKLNNLKVGDKLKIENPQDQSDSKVLELTVSGIYFDGVKAEDIGFKHPMLNRKNEIITTYSTLKEYDKKVNDGSVAIEAKYYLKDPDLLEAFNEEAHEKGLSDLYDVSIDANSYNNIVKAVEGLKKISNIFMVLVLGFGGSILILISILSTRERKYEIGVLRAMGMKKGKVALGLIFETLSMIAVSLVIGLSIGSFSAQPVSDILLKGQLEAANNMSSGFMVSIGAQTNVPKLENLDIYLNGEAILSITLIALLLGIISVSIGIIYINRYEPRKILTERN